MSATTAPSTRRALFGGFGAIGLSATLVPLLSGGRADAQSPAAADVDALVTVLVSEQGVAVTYRETLRSGQLGGRATRRVRSLYAEEVTHVRLLRGPLRGTSVTLGPAQKVFAAHHLHSERDALRLLLTAEDAAIGACFKAMSQLRSAALLRLTAGVMASDAQHAAVLGELLHPDDISRAVPDPFVQGTP